MSSRSVLLALRELGEPGIADVGVDDGDRRAGEIAQREAELDR